MSRVVQELLKFSEAYFDKTIHSFMRQRSEAFWAGVRSGAAWICGTRRLGKASGDGVPPVRLGKRQRKQKGALPQRCGKAPFCFLCLFPSLTGGTPSPDAFPSRRVPQIHAAPDLTPAQNASLLCRIKLWIVLSKYASENFSSSCTTRDIYRSRS